MKQINHFSDSSYHGNGCCNGTGKVSLFLSCRCLLWSTLPELFKNLCLSLSPLSCVWLYLVCFNLSIDTFRGSDFEEGRMSYREFVWFLLAEEDKRHMTRWELPWLGCVCLCLSFLLPLSLLRSRCSTLSVSCFLSHSLSLMLSVSPSFSLLFLLPHFHSPPLSHPFPPHLFFFLPLAPPPPPPPLCLSLYLFRSLPLPLPLSASLFPLPPLLPLGLSLPLSLYDIPANTEPPPPSPWCLQYWVLVPLHGSRWRRSCFHVWDGILPWGADEQDGDARNREAAVRRHCLPGKSLSLSLSLSLSWLDLSFKVERLGIEKLPFKDTVCQVSLSLSLSLLTWPVVQDVDARYREAAVQRHRLPGKPVSLSLVLTCQMYFFMRFNETQICWSEIQIVFSWARSLI